jgi:GGDEF domain-containing protein
VTLPPFVRPALAPAVILVATTLALWLAPSLPASLAGLRTAGPYAVLGAAVAVALGFNRGRAFFFAITLLAAFAGCLIAADGSSLAAKAAYTAITVLVPLNALVALVLPERSVVHHGAWRWIALLAAEGMLVAWLVLSGHSAAHAEAWQAMLESFLLRSPPTPLVGRLMFAAAFVAAAWRAWPRHTPLDVGIAAALIGFFVACEFRDSQAAFNGFFGAAGAILIVALLQESFRLAFYDELTGLPGRRALEERMRALGPGYALAMVDVDHFKKFNDTHGHDTGDQVLKLVAARLAEVGHGGSAYRYGGEEFTVLFPDRRLVEALRALEAIRGSIESYRMALRREDRPKDAKEGSRLRGGGAPAAQSLSVTVSIGVAEPAKTLTTPARVMKAADEALYRAKQSGRNRVAK